MHLDGAMCQTSAHAELSQVRRSEAPRPREVVRRYRRLGTRSAREGGLAKPQPSEPPDADPHVRWCGRGVAVRRYPLCRYFSHFGNRVFLGDAQLVTSTRRPSWMPPARSSQGYLASARVVLSRFPSAGSCADLLGLGLRVAPSS
jgi:hypothetical protein